MREMQTKFGAEVKDFAYAFVIKHHHPGWDSPSLPLQPANLILPTAKAPKYIEVKSRP
jgi:hypothetical protein